MKALGWSWGQVAKLAADRSRWRSSVSALCASTHEEVHTCNFTRLVPFANGTRRVARVHTASGSSGTLRPHRKVFSVDANGTRRVGAAV